MKHTPLILLSGLAFQTAGAASNLFEPYVTFQISELGPAVGVTFKPGSTIPLKFRLKDANGNTVQAASASLWLVPTQFDYLPVTLPDDFEFQVSNSTYEWRKNQDSYVYEWNTKGLPDRSIWAVGVKLDDGKTYYVFVALVK